MAIFKIHKNNDGSREVCYINNVTHELGSCGEVDSSVTLEETTEWCIEQATAGDLIHIEETGDILTITDSHIN